MKTINEYFDDDSVFTITKCEMIVEMVREREQLVYLIEADQEDKHGVGDIPPDCTEVDKLRSLIVKKLKDVKNVAPVDFILEVLDMLGYGGILLENNDNGQWIVIGSQTLMDSYDSEFDPEIHEMYDEQWWYKKSELCDSIREAVINLLDRIME